MSKYSLALRWRQLALKPKRMSKTLTIVTHPGNRFFFKPANAVFEFDGRLVLDDWFLTSMVLQNHVTVLENNNLPQPGPNPCRDSVAQVGGGC